MIEHSLDLPLAVIVALILVREGVQLTKYLVARMNGGAPSGQVTRADLLEAKAELLEAMRTGQDQLHSRITEIDVRLARLEGRS